MHDHLTIQPGFYQLLVRTDNKIICLKVSDIIFFEASDKYVKIITAKKTYLALTSLSDLEGNLFPEFFRRTHRSYIINMLYLVYIYDGVVNLGDYDIPLSEGYELEFFMNLQLLN